MRIGGDSDLNAGPGRDAHEHRDESGATVRTVSSGVNVVPEESRAAPKSKELAPGPVVDKLGSYKPATYAITVAHNSEGGATRMVREDR